MSAIISKKITTNIRKIPIYVNNFIYCGKNIIKTDYYHIFNCEDPFEQFSYSYERNLNIDLKNDIYPMHNIIENISYLKKYMSSNDTILCNINLNIKEYIDMIWSVIGETYPLSSDGDCENFVFLYDYTYETPNIDDMGIISINFTKVRVFISKPLKLGNEYLVGLNANLSEFVGRINAEYISYSPS